MRRRRFRKQRTRNYVLALLLLSVIALLLPSTWTRKLISLAQVLVPFQHATTAAVDSLNDSLEPETKAVSGEEHAAFLRERAGLEHQVAALSARVEELEQEVDILTATRLWGSQSGRIGAQGRLIPARVVAKDLLPWRSSKLLNVGSLQGVRSGAPVSSDEFSIDRGSDGGLQSGMTILLREALVGVVEQVGPYASRVKLLSDVDVAMKVKLGRFTDEGFAVTERYFWLTGRGGGVMEIRDAKRQEVDEGLIQVGDTVLSDPNSEMLPAAMTIGRVTAIQPDHDNPLLAILTVRGAVAEADLRRVYVFDPGEEKPGSGRG
jgi:cell shape-determining protein MreC